MYRIEARDRALASERDANHGSNEGRSNGEEAPHAESATTGRNAEASNGDGWVSRALRFLPLEKQNETKNLSYMRTSTILANSPPPPPIIVGL